MPITDYLETLDIDTLVWIAGDMLTKEELGEIGHEAQISFLQWYTEEEALTITLCAFIAKHCKENPEDTQVVTFMESNNLEHYEL